MLLPVVYGVILNWPFPSEALKYHDIEHMGLHSALHEYGPNVEPSATLTSLAVGNIVGTDGPSAKAILIIKIRYRTHLLSEHRVVAFHNTK